MEAFLSLTIKVRAEAVERSARAAGAAVKEHQPNLIDDVLNAVGVLNWSSPHINLLLYASRDCVTRQGRLKADDVFLCSHLASI